MWGWCKFCSIPIVTKVSLSSTRDALPVLWSHCSLLPPKTILSLPFAVHSGGTSSANRELKPVLHLCNYLSRVWSISLLSMLFSTQLHSSNVRTCPDTQNSLTSFPVPFFLSKTLLKNTPFFTMYFNTSFPAFLCIFLYNCVFQLCKEFLNTDGIKIAI